MGMSKCSKTKLFQIISIKVLCKLLALQLFSVQILERGVTVSYQLRKVPLKSIEDDILVQCVMHSVTQPKTTNSASKDK